MKARAIMHAPRNRREALEAIEGLRFDFSISVEEIEEHRRARADGPVRRWPRRRNPA